MIWTIEPRGDNSQAKEGGREKTAGFKAFSKLILKRPGCSKEDMQDMQEKNDVMQELPFFGFKLAFFQLMVYGERENNERPGYESE